MYRQQAAQRDRERRIAAKKAREDGGTTEGGAQVKGKS